MNAASPSPLLPTVLRVFGLIFIFGIVILNRVWPSGWAWQPEQPAYLQMILGIYVTLGVFLLLAARDPRSEEHTSELQSRLHLVCRLLLEKKKKMMIQHNDST